MKIIGIVGSPRAKGNTSTLVKTAIDMCQSMGYETEIIQLSDYNFAGCNGCEGCKKSQVCVVKDDMQAIYPKLEEASGIILGSPTYFYNITSLTQKFIERMYNYECFDPDDRSVWTSKFEALGMKYAMTIAISEQDNYEDMGHTSKAMNMPLAALGFRVVSTHKILKLYEQKAALGHFDILDEIKAGASKLIKTIELNEKIRKQYRNTEAQ